MLNKLLLIAMLLIMFGSGFALGLVCDLFSAPTSEDPLLLQECIDKTYDAAKLHNTLIRRGEDIRHNIYWQNVHLSTAYWLEKLKGVEE